MFLPANIVDSPDAVDLLVMLDGLPLAIAQAGAFLRETKTSIAKYIGFYKKKWQNLQVDGPFSPPLIDYHSSVQTTWNISYDIVRQEHEDAANLLQLWAYLDNKDLWYELLTGVADLPNLPSWIRDIARDELSFIRAIRTLLSYSLIESRHNSAAYFIHPVVHEWALQTLSGGPGDELAWVAVAVVASGVADYTRTDYWMLQHRLLPHADRCYRWIEEGLKNRLHLHNKAQREAIANHFYRIGYLYIHQEKHKKAMNMSQLALGEFEMLLGPTHKSTLNAMNNLGTVYQVQGKLRDAKQMYKQALVGYRKMFGMEHVSTLDTISNLGSIYRALGKLDKAEKQATHALSGYERSLGLERIAVLNTVNNLGNIYYDQGRLHEAGQMYQRALNGFEKISGSGNQFTLRLVNNLGNVHLDKGENKMAEQMYQRALEGFETVLGADHISTLQTRHSLGNMYHDQGVLGKAEQMYQMALTGYEKSFSPQHATSLITICKLGSLYRTQSKPGEAKRMYMQAWLGFWKAVGREHSLRTGTGRILADLYAQECREVCFSDQTTKRPFKLLQNRQQYQLNHNVFQLARMLGKPGLHIATVLAALGRVLIWVDDEINANASFQQAMVVEDGVWRHDLIKCDSCDVDLNSTIKRFICKICVDVDLCHSCMVSYNRHGLQVPNCANHPFLKVPGPFPQETKESFDKRRGSMSLWAQALQRKYKNAVLDVSGVDKMETNGGSGVEKMETDDDLSPGES